LHRPTLPGRRCRIASAREAVPTVKTHRFDSEDILTEAVASLLAGRVPGTRRSYLVEMEHEGGFGRADIVLFSLNRPLLRRRLSVSRYVATTPRFAAVLLAAQKRPLSCRSLARRTNMRPQDLRRRYLASLVKAGLLEPTPTGCYRLAIPREHPIGVVVAIEAKLDKWRRALFQAQRYRAFANASYVTVPEPKASRLLQHRRQFRKTGVGLICVDERLRTQVPIRAVFRRPSSSILSLLSREKLLGVLASLKSTSL
jgi:hypothetical protein